MYSTGWVTYAIGSIASNAIGTKGMGAAAKTGMASARVAVIKGASKAKEFVQIPQRTPWEYQFAVDGQVPYNTINSKGLMERLSAFSAEGKVGKSTGNSVPSYGKNSISKGPYREVNGYPVKVKPGAQEKHVPNTPNYKQEIANGKNKSIFYGNNKTAQELLDKFAGEGELLKNGRERVDFGEPIGKYYDRNTGDYLETTKGLIHYGKDGAHIVPSRP